MEDGCDVLINVLLCCGICSPRGVHVEIGILPFRRSFQSQMKVSSESDESVGKKTAYQSARRSARNHH